MRDIFRRSLYLAERVREQRQKQRGKKVYSLHAPEVECGQFVTHVKAIPGALYDGHTLGAVFPEMEQQIGATIKRIVTDRGYRGHNAPEEHKFRVFISGQRRRVTETIKRELRRRSAVEPVIGHLTADHRMGRNFLAHTAGDAANAVLAAAGYNFRRLLKWLALLCAFVLAAFTRADTPENHLAAA